MVTFADLRDARLGPLAEAAQAWTTVSKAFADLEGRCAVEVTGFLHGSGWAGSAAGEALRRADELDDEFELVSMQSRTAAAVLRNAAEQFQGVRRRLLAAIDGADAAGLRVDDDGRAHPQAMTYAERHDPDADLVRLRAMENSRIYSDLIARIVDEATDADRSTARALRALAPAMPGQFAWEYNKATDAAQAAAAALGLDEDDLPIAGTDPRTVRGWWDGLSADQRQVLLTAYPERLGGLDGLPAVDRDYANQLALRNYIGDNVNHYRDQNNPQHDRALMLLDKLEAAETAPPHKRLYLLSVDPVGDGEAAVAIGNPDTAAHTAVLVPGVGTELDDIRGQISRANDLQDAALEQAPGADVSVIAWLGYDTPSLDDDVVTAAFGAKSQAGAQALDGFVDGLRAAHDDSPSHVTVIGHSYGSTVVGEAASTGDGIAADDVVAVGSPGMRVDDTGEFNIDGSHVWVGAAADDNFVARPENSVGPLRYIPIIGPALADGAEGIHGPAPHDPAFGGNVLHVDTSGHSGYWERDSMILRSQGAIIVGHYDAVVLDHGATP